MLRDGYTSMGSIYQRWKRKLVYLCGNDNPKALEPREIEKSRRKGPFAVRTVFGWTMNDPLGRERTGGNHTDNLMK